MNVLIIGSGRMGIRHAQGVQTIESVSSIVMSDVDQSTLNNVASKFSDTRFRYCLVSNLEGTYKNGFDVCIIAATAASRLELIKLASRLKCSNILIEKPLGQSLNQVIELQAYVEKMNLNCSVNLNMRLYNIFRKLKNDLLTIEQFNGEKTITINTGTLGIGANGIHYLDLLYFLLGADRAVLIAAEIDNSIIPSGRGPEFADFGGWAVIKFYTGNTYLGKVLISMSSVSTVFGSWEIVCANGRIYLNEVEGVRIDTLRELNSTMPINRYYADYLPPILSKFESQELGILTAKWIRGIELGEKYLPELSETIKVHELLFQWLSKSLAYNDIFPIT